MRGQPGDGHPGGYGESPDLEASGGRSKEFLIAHRTELDTLAEMLCEHETVDGSQIDAILGKTEIPVKASEPGDSSGGCLPIEPISTPVSIQASIARE